MTLMTPAEVLGLPRGRALERDDLDAMPADGHRYELIDGTLIVSPAPRTAHQRASAHLFRALDRVVAPSCELLYAPLDVVLADDTVIQPDLLIAARDQFAECDLPTAPLLAVDPLPVQPQHRPAAEEGTAPTRRLPALLGRRPGRTLHHRLDPRRRPLPADRARRRRGQLHHPRTLHAQHRPR